MLKKLIIANKTESISPAVEQISDFCCHAGLDSKECFRIQVILAEILNNIIEHSQINSPGESVEIRCQIDEQKLVLTTIDSGIPFETSTLQTMPDIHAESGRGWPIIFEWADHVEQYRHKNANCLHVTLTRTHA